MAFQVGYSAALLLDRRVGHEDFGSVAGTIPRQAYVLELSFTRRVF